jgi:cystinosin
MAIYLESISRLIGWVYMICWSLSFYPQPILNFRRRSTSGTTIDFPAINVLGFVAYCASTAAFLYSPQIRREYALRHHGLMPTVRLNDVAFAAHAVLLSTITLSQFAPVLWGFERRGGGAGARVSRSVVAVLMGCICAIVASAGKAAMSRDPDPRTAWAWIDVVCIFAVFFP